MKCKRFLAMLCCICIAFCCGTSTSAADLVEIGGKPMVKLSSYSHEECLEYLESVGVHYPKEFEGLDIDVSQMIAVIEENPGITRNYNSLTSQRFFEGMCRAVDEYYGRYYPNYALSTYAATGLQYSVLSSWNPNTMPKYNCYAYALGLTDKFYHPGSFYGHQLSYDAKVESLAQLTEGDLTEGWGYCVTTQTTRPSSLGNWDNVIAVRYGEDNDFLHMPDFHFTKLSGNKWYHKPGKTAILTFKSAPQNSVDWISEGYNGEFITGDTTYFDDIIYILYRAEHDHETYTGNNYHTENYHRYQVNYTCNTCGKSGTCWKKIPCSGNPCITPYSITPPSETSR